MLKEIIYRYAIFLKIAKPNEELSGWFDQPKTYDNHND